MAARLLHVTSPLMTGSDVTGIGGDSMAARSCDASGE